MMYNEDKSNMDNEILIVCNELNFVRLRVSTTNSSSGNHSWPSPLCRIEGNLVVISSQQRSYCLKLHV